LSFVGRLRKEATPEIARLYTIGQPARRTWWYLCLLPYQPPYPNKALNKEARQWEKEIAEEKPEQTARLLEEAEPFVAHRPPWQPVSLRLDPRDLLRGLILSGG